MYWTISGASTDICAATQQFPCRIRNIGHRAINSPTRESGIPGNAGAIGRMQVAIFR
jgi:hypothetical protein